MSRPLSSVRALLLTRRRLLSTHSVPLPRKRPFTSAFSSFREDKSEPTSPGSTVRRDGPIIAQGRRASGDVKTRRHEARHRAGTEGGSYERNIAQAARKGRAGPRFHPGPPDGRGWGGDGA